ncbi:hypothetical protein PIROE2DRAFT_61224 [Piromyces sp. E2]|nr:hypothetical protein PIROE2DRAFT_61224 [Piromyces sp. E2]|eukprot:OUM63546.1 hypothetical protein PIROE2DRAFT_61224 [Piromyces sp. E2]
MPLTEHEYVTKSEKWAVLDMTATPNSKPQPQPQQPQLKNKPLPTLQVPSPGTVPTNKPSVPSRNSSSTFQSPNTPNAQRPGSRASSPSPVVPLKSNNTPTSPQQHLSANQNARRLSPPSSPAKSPAGPVTPGGKSPVQKSPTSPANEELEKLIEQFEKYSIIFLLFYIITL